MRNGQHAPGGASAGLRNRSAALCVSALLLGLGGATDAGAQAAAPPARVKGGQDMFGPYEVVADWPKPLATLPGHDAWTYGAAQSVFAESPNRVLVLQRGELPIVARPATRALPELGPSLQFPLFRLPIRDATVASPPGGGAAGTMPADGIAAWQ